MDRPTHFIPHYPQPSVKWPQQHTPTPPPEAGSLVQNVSVEGVQEAAIGLQVRVCLLKQRREDTYPVTGVSQMRRTSNRATLAEFDPRMSGGRSEKWTRLKTVTEWPKSENKWERVQ